jgi:hypothetical protein
VTDDYLADRRGPADPEVERLEQLLGEARYVPGRLKLPADDAGTRRGRSRARRFAPWAIAASIVLLAGGWLTYRSLGLGESSFAVREVGPHGARLGRLRVGSWLETDAQSRAEVVIASIGNVSLEPSSRLRLEATGPLGHRLRLEQGTLQAKVSAPPRLFVVDTPSAKATDLGCEYRLSVDGEGDTKLSVMTGQVSLEGHGLESTVFAGYECETLRGHGPGLPVRLDAALALRDAVRRVDSGDGSAWEAVVSNANRDDATTLWHLLPRVNEASRGRVRGRLAELVTPAGCQDDGLVRLDAAALRKCWGAVSRQWEASGP